MVFLVIFFPVKMESVVYKQMSNYYGKFCITVFSECSGQSGRLPNQESGLTGL